MSPIDRVAVVTVAVKDQEEALRWFTDKLGFTKRQDRHGAGIALADRGAGARSTGSSSSWRPGSRGMSARARRWSSTRGTVARRFGSSPTAASSSPRPPQDRPYGVEAVFKDLYGNPYALVEPATAA